MDYSRDTAFGETGQLNLEENLGTATCFPHVHSSSPQPAVVRSDRQHPNAVTKGIHSGEGASFQVRFSGLDCSEHDTANRGW